MSRIPDIKIFESKIFEDERGFFMESFNKQEFCAAIGREVEFVQDNCSGSCQGSLRGLHYQIEHPQGKLVRALAGEVYDIAVDLRKSSPTFGKWTAVVLSDKNGKMIWIPEGFAHGFLALTENALLHYKATDYYWPQGERCIRYDDPDLAIDWPVRGEPIISDKDRQGISFSASELF